MTAPIQTRSRKLLIDAAEWRLVSLLFDCPGPAWRKQVKDLSSEVADSELRSCALLAVDQAQEGVYHSTFGPGGPASPREATYCDTLQLGYLMSELQSHYEAFGYSPPVGEPPDHISVECGFHAFLRVKQVFAAESGDLESVSVTGESAARFLKEHLARIAAPLARSLGGDAPEYLLRASRALLQRVGWQAEPAASPAGELPVLNDANDFACGEQFTCD